MESKQKIISLIQKYLNNACTEKELDEMIQLFHREDYKNQIELLLYEYWQSTPSFQHRLDEKELGEMLNAIHHQINVDASRQKKGFLKRLTYYAVRAAAILFIPLLIGSLWMFFQDGTYSQSDAMIKLETPLGSTLKTTLPDGTEVWQNAGTSLKYPAKFTRRNRQVELVGEAYFHVSSDKKNPFYVKTADGTVQVTGTRFDVSAFPEDHFSSVVLEEGAVAYQLAGSKKLVGLNPSEQLVYVKETGALVKRKTDVEKYISWTEGKLIFRNDPLSDVIIRLERWYNADIVLEDPNGKLGEHPFTMTVQNETLPQVLTYISQAANLKLEKQDMGLTAGSNLVKPQYTISKN
jgi:ferric-dicitrate binding protein FerR (iron transport regulator)